MKTKDLQVIEKGWQINLLWIDEGYLYSECVCSATTKGKAKSKLLKQNEVRNMILRTGEELTFLNIPLIACPEVDLVMYEGEPVRRNKVSEIEQRKAHQGSLQAIIDDVAVTHCYIRKRGTYYQDNYCGYTEYRIAAGVYPKADAVNHCRRCEDLTAVPIDIEDHNAHLNKHIESVKQRLIIH